MKYIYNSEMKEISFKKEDIEDDSKHDEIIKETENIRTQILPKFLSSDNLNFLISNGCSCKVGAKLINNGDEKNNYIKLLKEFKFTDEKTHSEFKKKINSYYKLRPEEVLDRLYQIKIHFEEIDEDIDAVEKVYELISDFKKSFLEEFILNIDYSQNQVHKKFLKKIISRDSKLNKVNVFTLNYDLLIEKTAEQLGIYINNGFFGFHDRCFLPSSYQLDLHLSNTSVGKKYTKSLNLYKLHGSISWYEDSNKPPYGISEKQLFPDKQSNKISYEQIKNETIIYPVQSKKKHSLDLPYSELFRQFVEALNRQNSTLIVIGYSFLDEHVNDIITNALANPDFNIVAFCFDSPEETKSSYYKELYEHSKDDHRITIFTGDILGDFEFIVKYLIPYTDDNKSDEIIFKTFQELLKIRETNATTTK